MLKIRWRISYWLVIFLISFSLPTSARSINSATITAATIKALPHCLHYQVPIHFCLWINKLGQVNTTPIVSHYLPDLVVTVFNKPNDNPWFEVDKLIDKASKPVQQVIVHGLTGFDSGTGRHSLQNTNEQTVLFKEADVIGNPALMVIPEHGLLPSTAKPWVPYFQSMADSILWKGLPPAALLEESSAVLLNLKHHVGTGITNWGGLYPHEGKVVADNDMKAAAVIALRAADLTTSQTAVHHIVKQISKSCGEHCKAAPIQENSKETYFQMIYPIEQSDCHILGESDSYQANMLNNKEGSYAWIVWRHYEGCADGDGKYIGRT